MRNLSLFMPNITKEAVGRKGLIYGKLLKNWSHIISSEKAKMAIPEKISFHGKNSNSNKNQNGATLYVATTSAYASILTHETPLWIEKINLFFGYPAIEKIKFVHNLQKDETQKKTSRRQIQSLTTQEKEDLLKLIEKIENKELKEALYNYGYSLSLDMKNKKL